MRRLNPVTSVLRNACFHGGGLRNRRWGGVAGMLLLLFLSPFLLIRIQIFELEFVSQLESYLLRVYNVHANTFDYCTFTVVHSIIYVYSTRSICTQTIYFLTEYSVTRARSLFYKIDAVAGYMRYTRQAVSHALRSIYSRLDGCRKLQLMQPLFCWFGSFTHSAYLSLSLSFSSKTLLL